MARFRKKPVEVEASEWHKNGDHPLDYEKPLLGYRVDSDELVETSGEEQRAARWEGQVVRYWRRPDVSGETLCRHASCGRAMQEHGWIDTLEGGHIVCPGDWVITGVQGERYPCKPDIFAKTYEPVP